MTVAPRIRILADDLTGALDSAAAFADSVGVYLDEPPPGRSAGVAVVATPTRDVDPATLPARLAPLADWFAGGDIAFKKVDSLLRGNTFVECAHLARAGGFDEIVFAPAYPDQGRLTVAGRQLVAGPTGTAPAGPPIADAFARAFAALDPTAASPRVNVPDVHTDADLVALAREAVPGAADGPVRRLWCGSAGLAHALAAAIGTPPGTTPGASSAPADAPPPEAGVLMLGASHHPVVRRQWARLRARWPRLAHVAEGDAGEFAAACERLSRPGAVAALELSPQDVLTPEQAAALLKTQLAELVARARPPGMLLVLGGDTLFALCRETGVRRLDTRPSVRPGWGHARLAGGRWDGVDAHSRSGAFGGDDDLAEMLGTALALAAPSSGFSAPSAPPGRR